jgi:hypothetical protein
MRWIALAAMLLTAHFDAIGAQRLLSVGTSAIEQ